MKKTYNHLIAAVIGILMSTFQSKATENLEITTFENMRTIRMELSSPSAEAINVYLKDRRDNVIFRDQIGPGFTFENDFDLSGVSNGTYTLVSEVENLRYNRVLQVTSSRVRLVDSYYSFRPAFDMTGEHLLVHYINSGGDALDITIENRSGFLFETGYPSTDVVFQEAISMKGMKKGYYTLYLRNKGELFSYNFKVE